MDALPRSPWIREAVERELARAYAQHGADQWGRHEFYAILLEEVEELWSVVKADGPPEDLLAEMVQVVAMVYRYYDTGNRYGDGL